VLVWWVTEFGVAPEPPNSGEMGEFCVWWWFFAFLSTVASFDI